MPACYQLSRTDNLDAGPVNLVAIDEDICRHFGVEIHPTKWYCDWHQAIGFRLAIGKTFDEIIAEFDQSAGPNDEDTFYARLAQIARYLKCAYTNNAWYGR
jgi:hypothetical protein